MNQLNNYSPNWDNKYLSQSLIKSSYNYNFLADEVCSGAFSFPLFSDGFCSELENMLFKFDGWTEGRHKNYPTNDILLKDFDGDLYKIYCCILRNIVIQAVNKLYNSHFKESALKEETFIIRYKPSKQSLLNLHHDSSVFTCGVQLSEPSSYSGGELYMPQHKFAFKSPRGKCLLHPGKLTHRHGVRPVTSGEKYSLISFCNF